MSKNRPVEFELEERRPERHQQDVGRREPVDRQIAERGGRIEEDQVVVVQHARPRPGSPQRVPELPAARGHPPDRDLELRPVEVQLRADQVDVGPVGRPDHVGRGDLQRLGQRLVERHGASPRSIRRWFSSCRWRRVMPGEQRKDRAPFVLDPGAEDRGHRALAVEVDHQHPVAVERRRHRQMRGGRGLADAALEVRHRHDLGGQPLGAVGQVLLGLGPLGAEMGAQAQHLVEGEPLRAALGLGRGPGQVGVGAQHAAEMRGRDRDQVLVISQVENRRSRFSPPSSRPRPARSSRPRGRPRRSRRSRRCRRARPARPAPRRGRC